MRLQDTLFYLVAFVAVIQSTSTQDYLLTTGSLKPACARNETSASVVVLKFAVRIFRPNSLNRLQLPLGEFSLSRHLFVGL